MQESEKKCCLCFWRFFCIFPCEEISEDLERIENELEKRRPRSIKNKQ